MSLLIGTAQKLFAIPVAAEIHEGTIKLHQLLGKKFPQPDDGKPPTVVTLMIALAIQVVKVLSTPSVIVLDAHFAVGPAFLLARKCRTNDGTPLLDIITKAKSNVVSFI